jgi:hypothetical protein
MTTPHGHVFFRDASRQWLCVPAQRQRRIIGYALIGVKRNHIPQPVENQINTLSGRADAEYFWGQLFGANRCVVTEDVLEPLNLRSQLIE